jgi:hypothetical protein
VQIIGVDFTSTPSPRKPITLAVGELVGSELNIWLQASLTDWVAFEWILERPGPWFGGFDLPFSQSRKFIKNSKLPTNWEALIDQLPPDRAAWRKQLDDYKRDREPGDRQHMRKMDTACRSCSPQMQYGVPVAMMFWEGIRRLRRAEVRCLPMQKAGERTAVEAYPGAVMDILIGERKYKSDTRSKQTELHRLNRERAVKAIQNDNPFGITFRDADFTAMVDDPTGDTLDAALCALQAAYAYRHGFPPEVDRLEGWILLPIGLDSITMP